MPIDIETAFARCPMVAILRGLKPEEALDVGGVLLDAGFTLIEVPLNSPEPFQSIARLARRYGDDAVFGAGTVMTPGDVDRLADSGGRLVVMPHSDPVIIRAAKAAGLWCGPGVATPTEGFAALAAGADALKLFPADALPPAVLKAWRSVFPKSTRFLPVGGIDATNMRAYLAAGADGFGIGSTLFKPGKPLADIKRDAKILIAAYRKAREELAAAGN